MTWRPPIAWDEIKRVLPCRSRECLRRDSISGSAARVVPIGGQAQIPRRTLQHGPTTQRPLGSTAARARGFPVKSESRTTDRQKRTRDIFRKQIDQTAAADSRND